MILFTSITDLSSYQVAVCGRCGAVVDETAMNQHALLHGDDAILKPIADALGAALAIGDSILYAGGDGNPNSLKRGVIVGFGKDDVVVFTTQFDRVDRRYSDHVVLAPERAA